MAAASFEMSKGSIPKSRSENLLTENKKIPRSSTNFDLYGLKVGTSQRSPSANLRTLKQISKSPTSDRLHIKSSDSRYLIPIPFTLKLPPKLSTKQESPTGKDLRESSEPSLPHRHSRLVFTGREYEDIGYLSESDIDESDIIMQAASAPSPESALAKPSSRKGVPIEEPRTIENANKPNIFKKPSKEQSRFDISELRGKENVLARRSFPNEKPDRQRNSNLNTMTRESDRMPHSPLLFNVKLENDKNMKSRNVKKNYKESPPKEKLLPRAGMHETLIHKTDLQTPNKQPVASNSLRLSFNNYSQGHTETCNPPKSSALYPSSQRNLHLKRSSNVSNGKRKPMVRTSKIADDIISDKFYESSKSENGNGPFGSSSETFPISHGNLNETKNGLEETLDRDILSYLNHQDHCDPNTVQSGQDFSPKDMFSFENQPMHRISKSKSPTPQGKKTAKIFGENISKINRYQTVFCSDNQRESSNNHVYLPRGHADMVNIDSVNDIPSPEIHVTGGQNCSNTDDYYKGAGKCFYFPNSTENATNAEIVREQVISEEESRPELNNACNKINQSGQIVIPDINELEAATSEMKDENIIKRNGKKNREYNRFFDPFPKIENVKERHRSLENQTDLSTFSKNLSEQNFEASTLLEDRLRRVNANTARHSRRKSMFNLDDITQNEKYESQGHHLPRSNSFSSKPSLSAKCFPQQADSTNASSSQVHDEVEYLGHPRYDKKSKNFSPFPVDLLCKIDYERDIKESLTIGSRSPPEIKYNNEAKKAPSIASKTDSSTSSISNSDVLSRGSNTLTKATSISDRGSISNDRKEDSVINIIPKNSSSYSQNSFNEPFLEGETIKIVHDYHSRDDLDESDLISIYSKYRKPHMFRDISNGSSSSCKSCLSSNESTFSEENLDVKPAKALEAQLAKSRHKNLHCIYPTNQPLGYGEGDYLLGRMTRSKSQSLDFLDLLQEKFRKLKVHGPNSPSNYFDYKGPKYDFQTYMKQCTKSLDIE